MLAALHRRLSLSVQEGWSVQASDVALIREVVSDVVHVEREVYDGVLRLAIHRKNGSRKVCSPGWLCKNLKRVRAERADDAVGIPSETYHPMQTAYRHIPGTFVLKTQTEVNGVTSYGTVLASFPPMLADSFTVKLCVRVDGWQPQVPRHAPASASVCSTFAAEHGDVDHRRYVVCATDGWWTGWSIEILGGGVWGVRVGDGAEWTVVSRYSAAACVALSEWTTVAVAYDHVAGSLSLYVNNDLVASCPVRTVAASTAPLRLAAGPHGACGTGFAGLVRYLVVTPSVQPSPLDLHSKGNEESFALFPYQRSLKLRRRRAHGRVTDVRSRSAPSRRGRQSRGGTAGNAGIESDTTSTETESTATTSSSKSSSASASVSTDPQAKRKEKTTKKKKKGKRRSDRRTTDAITRLSAEVTRLQDIVVGLGHRLTTAAGREEHTLQLPTALHLKERREEDPRSFSSSDGAPSPHGARALARSKTFSYVKAAAAVADVASPLSSVDRDILAASQTAPVPAAAFAEKPASGVEALHLRRYRSHGSLASLRKLSPAKLEGADEGGSGGGAGGSGGAVNTSQKSLADGGRSASFAFKRSLWDAVSDHSPAASILPLQERTLPDGGDAALAVPASAEASGDLLAAGASPGKLSLAPVSSAASSTTMLSRWRNLVQESDSPFRSALNAAPEPADAAPPLAHEALATEEPDSPLYAVQQRPLTSLTPVEVSQHPTGSPLSASLSPRHRSPAAQAKPQSPSQSGVGGSLDAAEVEQWVALIKERTMPDYSHKGLSKPAEVRPGIFLGDGKMAKRVGDLRSRGIKKVVNLAPAQCKTSQQTYSASGIEYLEISAEDDPEYPILQDLPAVVSFIDAPTLVHCFQGVNRSATLVAAYIMCIHRVPLLQAIQQVYTARPVVFVGNKGFVQSLVQHAHKVGLLKATSSHSLTGSPLAPIHSGGSAVATSPSGSLPRRHLSDNAARNTTAEAASLNDTAAGHEDGSDLDITRVSTGGNGAGAASLTDYSHSPRHGRRGDSAHLASPGTTDGLDLTFSHPASEQISDMTYAETPHDVPLSHHGQVPAATRSNKMRQTSPSMSNHAPLDNDWDNTSSPSATLGARNYSSICHAAAADEGSNNDNSEHNSSVCNATSVTEEGDNWLDNADDDEVIDSQFGQQSTVSGSERVTAAAAAAAAAASVPSYADAPDFTATATSHGTESTPPHGPMPDPPAPARPFSAGRRQHDTPAAADEAYAAAAQLPPRGRRPRARDQEWKTEKDVLDQFASGFGSPSKAPAAPPADLPPPSPPARKPVDARLLSLDGLGGVLEGSISEVTAMMMSPTAGERECTASPEASERSGKPHSAAEKPMDVARVASNVSRLTPNDAFDQLLGQDAAGVLSPLLFEDDDDDFDAAAVAGAPAVAGGPPLPPQSYTLPPSLQKRGAASKDKKKPTFDDALCAAGAASEGGGSPRDSVEETDAALPLGSDCSSPTTDDLFLTAKGLNQTRVSRWSAEAPPAAKRVGSSPDKTGGRELGRRDSWAMQWLSDPEGRVTPDHTGPVQSSPSPARRSPAASASSPGHGVDALDVLQFLGAAPADPVTPSGGEKPVAEVAAPSGAAESPSRQHPGGITQWDDWDFDT